jgi:hypothetical protein
VDGAADSVVELAAGEGVCGGSGGGLQAARISAEVRSDRKTPHLMFRIALTII